MSDSDSSTPKQPKPETALEVGRGGSGGNRKTRAGTQGRGDDDMSGPIVKRRSPWETYFAILSDSYRRMSVEDQAALNKRLFQIVLLLSTSAALAAYFLIRH